MITKAIILKDGEHFAEVEAQSLLPEETTNITGPDEDAEYLISSGSALANARVALQACFSEIVSGDIEVVFPELEG